MASGDSFRKSLGLKFDIKETVENFKRYPRNFTIKYSTVWYNLLLGLFTVTLKQIFHVLSAAMNTVYKSSPTTITLTDKEFLDYRLHGYGNFIKTVDGVDKRKMISMYPSLSVHKDRLWFSEDYTQCLEYDIYKAGMTPPALKVYMYLDDNKDLNILGFLRRSPNPSDLHIGSGDDIPYKWFSLNHAAPIEFITSNDKFNYLNCKIDANACLSNILYTEYHLHVHRIHEYVYTTFDVLPYSDPVFQLLSTFNKGGLATNNLAHPIVFPPTGPIATINGKAETNITTAPSSILYDPGFFDLIPDANLNLISGFSYHSLISQFKVITVDYVTQYILNNKIDESQYTALLAKVGTEFHQPSLTLHQLLVSCIVNTLLHDILHIGTRDIITNPNVWVINGLDFNIHDFKFSDMADFLRAKFNFKTIKYVNTIIPYDRFLETLPNPKSDLHLENVNKVYRQTIYFIISQFPKYPLSQLGSSVNY